MKKLVSILLGLFLCIGCMTGGSQVVYKRAPDFNVIDFGSYQLYIDKRFETVGDLTSEFEKEFIGAGDFKIKQTRYIFADTSGGKKDIKRAIAVHAIGEMK